MAEVGVDRVEKIVLLSGDKSNFTRINNGHDM